MSSSARASLAGVSAHEESNVYTSNFSAGVDGWTDNGGAVAGNIDGIGGQNDNLRFTTDNLSGQKRMVKNPLFTAGNCYRVRFDYYIPSGQSNIDGIKPYDGNWHGQESVTDAWTSVDLYFNAYSTYFWVFATDGGATTFQDAGGDDVFYIRNVIVDRWTRMP